MFDGVDEEALEASLCTKTLDDEFVLSSESEALELCKSTEIEDGSYTTGWLVPGDKEILENVTCKCTGYSMVIKYWMCLTWGWKEADKAGPSSETRDCNTPLGVSEFKWKQKHWKHVTVMKQEVLLNYWVGKAEWKKTREFFRKIRDIKGVFPENMGTIKDRKVMNLKEVEDIKEWWQEYIEELSKNIPLTQITMMVQSLTYIQTSLTVKSSAF